MVHKDKNEICQGSEIMVSAIPHEREKAWRGLHACLLDTPFRQAIYTIYETCLQNVDTVDTGTTLTMNASKQSHRDRIEIYEKSGLSCKRRAVGMRTLV